MKSDPDAYKVVKTLLGEQGLQSWEPIESSESSTMTALAGFQTREDAIKAVEALNGTEIRELGNFQLSLKHATSYTISLRAVMIHVLERQIDEWKSKITTKHNGIIVKSYPPAHNSSPYATIRISGTDVKAVAEAKVSLEAQLVGTVIQNKGTALWDPFFATMAGLDYLQNLQAQRFVYIYRDSSLRRIVVHGRNRAIAAVREDLCRKVQDLSDSNKHTIVLTPDLFQRALSGAYTAISAELGKSCVKMNISGQPKRMKIKGSTADYQLALKLLGVDAATLQVPATEEAISEEKEFCAICWDKATDPFRTPCNHIYCKECFEGQCNAATADDDFPVCCHGDQDKCTHIFSIESLQDCLASSVFEQLLESSFKVYVRKSLLLVMKRPD